MSVGLTPLRGKKAPIKSAATQATPTAVATSTTGAEKKASAPTHSFQPVDGFNSVPQQQAMEKAAQRDATISPEVKSARVDLEQLSPVAKNRLASVMSKKGKPSEELLPSSVNTGSNSPGMSERPMQGIFPQEASAPDRKARTVAGDLTVKDKPWSTDQSTYYMNEQQKEGYRTKFKPTTAIDGSEQFTLQTQQAIKDKEQNSATSTKGGYLPNKSNEPYIGDQPIFPKSSLPQLEFKETPSLQINSSPKPAITEPTPKKSRAFLEPSVQNNSSPKPAITEPTPKKSRAFLEPSVQNNSSPKPAITEPTPKKSRAFLEPSVQNNSSPNPAITLRTPKKSRAFLGAEPSVQNNSSPKPQQPIPTQAAATTPSKQIEGEKRLLAMEKDGTVFTAPQTTLIDLDNFNEIHTHHSSFNQGKPLAFAGEAVVRPDETLKGITDRSGHYQPTSTETVQGLNALEKQHGVKLDNIQFDMVRPNSTGRAGIADQVTHGMAREYLQGGGNESLFKARHQVADQIQAGAPSLKHVNTRDRSDPVLPEQGSGYVSTVAQNKAVSQAILNHVASQAKPL